MDHLEGFGKIIAELVSNRKGVYASRGLFIVALVARDGFRGCFIVSFA